jgi:DNA mismatch endonuclease, patch repair protein
LLRDLHPSLRFVGMLSPRSNPPASSQAVSRRMINTPRRDTPCELAIRRQIHRAGLRYRVDTYVMPSLRRRADLLFTSERVAVFVDGCFWHWCPHHGGLPKINREWWERKLARTRQRDAETTKRLSDAGWLVLRFWEHCAPERAANSIHRAVLQRRKRTADHRGG